MASFMTCWLSDAFRTTRLRGIMSITGPTSALELALRLLPRRGIHLAVVLLDLLACHLTLPKSSFTNIAVQKQQISRNEVSVALGSGTVWFGVCQSVRCFPFGGSCHTRLGRSVPSKPTGGFSNI